MSPLPLEALLAWVLAAATGVASAWVPLINAEAALAAAGLGTPAATALGVSLALAGGQTAGKLAMFQAARRGAARKRRGQHRKPAPQWQLRLLAKMRGQRRTDGVVLLSASVGLPPLALVSVVAGGLQGSAKHFTCCCLAGRTARFVVLLAVVWRAS